MKKFSLQKTSMVAVITIAITLLPPLALDAMAGGAKTPWCKYSSNGSLYMYEVKYDSNSASKAADENDESYDGLCEIDAADQSTETSTTFALCHYDSDTETWTQIYEKYTGYARAFYCKYKDGSYETKLEKTTKIDDKIAEDPSHHYSGICTDDTDTTVYCRYKDSEWKTKDDTASDAADDIADYSGSHYGGCTYHEWHMDSFGDDYWGYCTSKLDTEDLDTSPYDAYSPDAPNARTTGEKKLGVGSGAGPTGHRTYKPRMGY